MNPPSERALDRLTALGCGVLALLLLGAIWLWLPVDRPTAAPDVTPTPWIIVIVTTATPTPADVGAVLPTRTPQTPFLLKPSPSPEPPDRLPMRPTLTPMPPLILPALASPTPEPTRVERTPVQKG